MQKKKERKERKKKEREKNLAPKARQPSFSQ
jgi:hypothetical protein